MDRLKKVNRKVLKKVKITESKNDFDYWQKQPVEFRLAALEEIRKEYSEWKYGSKQRFQRVYSIVKRT